MDDIKYKDQISTKTLLMQKVTISSIKFVLNFVKSESSLGRIDETHFRRKLLQWQVWSGRKNWMKDCDLLREAKKLQKENHFYEVRRASQFHITNRKNEWKLMLVEQKLFQSVLVLITLYYSYESRIFIDLIK
jgi:hypothetical protein